MDGGLLASSLGVFHPVAVDVADVRDIAVLEATLSRESPRGLPKPVGWIVVDASDGFGEEDWDCC